MNFSKTKAAQLETTFLSLSCSWVCPGTQFAPMAWEQKWCVPLPDHVFITKFLALHVPIGGKMVTAEAVTQDSEMEATFWESWIVPLAWKPCGAELSPALAIVRNKFLFHLRDCIFGSLGYSKYPLALKKKKKTENVQLLTEGFLSILFSAISLAPKNRACTYQAFKNYAWIIYKWMILDF